MAKEGSMLTGRACFIVLFAFVFTALILFLSSERGDASATYNDPTDDAVFRSIDIQKVQITDDLEQLSVTTTVQGAAINGNFTVLVDRDCDGIADYSSTAMKMGTGKSIDYYMCHQVDVNVSYGGGGAITIRMPKGHFSNCMQINIQVVAWAIVNGTEYVKDYAPQMWFVYKFDFISFNGYKIISAERVDAGSDPAIDDINITMGVPMFGIPAWNASVHFKSNATLLFGEVSPIGDAVNSTSSYTTEGTIYDIPSGFFIVAAYTPSSCFIGSMMLFPVLDQRLDGWVTDTNDIPIENASVRVESVSFPGASIEIHSNATGYFYCSVFNGEYNITVQKDGFKSEKLYFVHSNSTVFIHMTKLSVRIWGYVFNESSGLPLEGVDVTCKEWGTRTSEGGYYSILILPGAFSIKYALEGYFKYEQSVEFPPETVVRIDVNLEPIPPLTNKIVGLVTSYDGQTLSNVLVVATDVVRGWSKSGITNDTGCYRLNVYEGTFIVTAQYLLRDYFSNTSGVVVDDPVETLDFMLYRASTKLYYANITGQVKNALGAGIWNARLYFWDKAEGHFHSSESDSVKVNDTGCFETRLYQGSFLCVVMAPGYQTIVANVSVTPIGSFTPFGNVLNITMNFLPQSSRLIITNISTLNIGWYSELLSMYPWQEADSTFFRWQIDLVFGNRDGFLSDTEVAALDVFIPYYAAWLRDMVGTTSENLIKVHGMAYTYSFNEMNVIFDFSGSIYSISPINITFYFRMDMVPAIEDTYSNYVIELIAQNDTYSINYVYVVIINDGYRSLYHTPYAHINFIESEFGHFCVDPTVAVPDYPPSTPTDVVTLIVDAIPPTIVTQSYIQVAQGANFTLDAGSSLDNSYEGIASYSWSVDGASALLGDIHIANNESASTSAVINVPGEYNITLTVRDSAWNFNTTVVRVHVLDTRPPVAGMICPSQADEDTLVNFSSNSTDNDPAYPAGRTFEWRIRSNRTGAEVHQASSNAFGYIFEVPGNYSVALRVYDQSGNMGETTCYIIIRDITPPVASITGAQTINEDSSELLSATYSTDNYAIASYAWDLDYEGNFTADITEPFAIVYFAQPGTYVVALNVTDEAGNWNMTLFPINVVDISKSRPFLSAPTYAPEDVPVQFSANGSSDNVCIVSYSWDFDSANGIQDESQGLEVVHTYLQPGEYEVTLTVRDAAGNENSTSVRITINDTTPPQARIECPLSWNEDLYLQFSGLGSFDNVLIANYSWKFLSGLEIIGTGYGPLASWAFATPGEYTAELTVADEAGNLNTTVVSVFIRDVTPPVLVLGGGTKANMTIDEDANTVFSCEGSSDNSPLSYEDVTWDFDARDGKDNANRRGFVVNYTYFEPGNYEITVKITDSAGLTNVTTIFITVKDVTRPVVRAGQDQNVEVNKKVKFDATASYDNVGIAKYLWDFGDGSTANTPEASHSYSKDGKYKVTLTITDVNGLENSTSIVVRVTSPPNYTMIYLTIGLVAILAVAGSILGIHLYRKWKLGGFIVETAMMIYRDGRLMSHISSKEGEGDSDILAGMLTAVESFMEDSFSKKYQSSGKVGKLEWSGKKILIEKKEKFTLVLVVDGYDWDKVHRMLKRSADRIEAEYGAQLVEWDGNIEAFAGVKGILASMLVKEGVPKREKASVQVPKPPIGPHQTIGQVQQPTPHDQPQGHQVMNHPSHPTQGEVDSNYGYGSIKGEPPI